MSEDVLLRFLSNGLIDVGGDDAKLDRLRSAATDLAAALKKTPSKAASYALVAFDPEAPADDPVICEALEALKARWATYVNTFATTPVAVVRAMLLDALAGAAADDDRIGIAFVASARNALPFMEAGDERAIWADVVATIEARVDARAEAEWATPDAITVPAMVFDPPAAIAVRTSPVSINEQALAKRVAAAIGPTDGAGQATGGNQFWPNQAQAWAGEFRDGLSQLLAETFAIVAKGSVISPIDLESPLGALAEAVSSHVHNTLSAVSAATAGLQRRTALIWWKEALYSQTAQVSYRSLSGPSAAALMAFDLHKQVPTYSPSSVPAFLFEAVATLPGSDDDRTYALSDLVAEARTEDRLTKLREEAGELVSVPEGRGPVLALIAHAGASDRGMDFRSLTGVPEDAQLTLASWATWIFREFQAARATQNAGGKSPRRSRKT